MDAVYNSSAATALRVIRATALETESAADRIATGLKINSASDSAAYWSIATTMKSDIAVRSAITDGISLSLGIIDTAYAAVEELIPLVDQFRSLMISGRYSTTERPKIAAAMDVIREQMISVVKSASFNGTNLLYRALGEPTSISLLTGIPGSGTTGTNQYSTIDLTRLVMIDEDPMQGILSKKYEIPGGGTVRRMFLQYAAGYRIGLYDATGVIAGAYSTKTGMWALDNMSAGLGNAAMLLGSLKKGLEINMAFSRNLGDIMEKGISTLVDADMTTESARLRALEVRMQLSIQALHIANGKPNLILSLFR